MNTEIKPTYVTFEQAKLLKENGFDISTDTCFHALLGYEIEAPINWDNGRGYLVRPEQWQVVEWLRVKHGIWISVSCELGGYYAYYSVHATKYVNSSIQKGWINGGNALKSPQEAYSAAFDYVLTNLI